jgi:hypothetical protein
MADTALLSPYPAASLTARTPIYASYTKVDNKMDVLKGEIIVFVFTVLSSSVT